VPRAIAGGRVSAVSSAIEESLKASGFDPNRQYVGFQIGEDVHMSPQIPCYVMPGGDLDARFQAGRTYAILVIAHEGDSRCSTRSDNWTVFSRNRRRSVLYTQMVEPTPTGPRLRTKPRPF
jgi:methionyl aminopeptidase